ncbi:MAG TPA: hypothetical protein PK467_11230, partial [Candidatus Wallbacteria bacterium]|nr:hypothetical protein [Candidatus Wallbacteria bacterium]
LYFIFFMNASALILANYLRGGAGGPLFLAALIPANIIAAYYFGGRKVWIITTVISYSYSLIFSYIIANFYYFDVFNVMSLMFSLLMIAYVYYAGNALLIFFFLAAAQLAALNAYFDYFNINPLFSGVCELREIILMPLIFIPLAAGAAFHKIKSETGYSGAYLTNLIMGLSFYIFLAGANPAPASIALACIGFVLAFVIFMLPSSPVEPSEAGYVKAIEGGPDWISSVDAEAAQTFRHGSQRSRAERAGVWICAFIAAACIAVYLFCVYSLSVPQKTVEFYSRGASLYYDDLAGYFARFNAPFSNLAVDSGGYAERELYRRKNFMVSPFPGWKIVLDESASGFLIKAAALDIKTLDGRRKSVSLDFPFLNSLIDERKAAEISPRFVYRLKAGLYKDGSSALLEFSLAGDRFVMLDESSPYNKFNSPVKSFFAVSQDSSHAAVYDFSGNLRIVSSSDAKTAMVISGISNFRSVCGISDGGFLILCADRLLKASPGEKRLECVAGPLPFGEREFNGVYASGGFALLAKEGAAEILDINNGASSPLQIDLNDSNRCVYYDGDIIACWDYFSQELSLHKVKRGSFSGFEPDGSAVVKTASESVIKLASAPGGRRIKAAEHDSKAGSVKLIEFDRDSLAPVKRRMIDNPAAPSAGSAFELGILEGTAVFSIACGESVNVIREGFFYDGAIGTFMDNSLSNALKPSLPSALVYKDGRIFWAADNRITVIGSPAGEETRIFESAR